MIKVSRTSVVAVAMAVEEGEQGATSSSFDLIVYSSFLGNYNDYNRPLFHRDK